MSILADLAANRLAFRDYFQPERKREEPLLPAVPPMEEEAFALPAVEAPQPQEIYRLDTRPSSPPSQTRENFAPDDDELLDRLVYRLERESRLASQPPLEE